MQIWYTQAVFCDTTWQHVSWQEQRISQTWFDAKMLSLANITPVMQLPQGEQNMCVVQKTCKIATTDCCRYKETMHSLHRVAKLPNLGQEWQEEKGDQLQIEMITLRCLC